MINPAEEIVNIWLQDCRKHFVMSNLVVPKTTRLSVSGKKIGGGRGKEIDFLSTDGLGNYWWVEVSVSPNPRLPAGPEKSRMEIVENAISKFAEEKSAWIYYTFKISGLTKWFIYSPNLFSFLSNKSNEEESYCRELKSHAIEAISFATVLGEVYDGLNYLGYDSPRQYIFLLKKMGYKRRD